MDVVQSSTCATHVPPLPPAMCSLMRHGGDDDDDGAVRVPVSLDVSVFSPMLR